MAGTVTLDQLEKINYIIGPKATSLATSVIRLHSSENQEKKWTYTGLCGALCFIIDRKLGGVAIFKMYDLNSFDLLFEAELYFDFQTCYTEINDNFYCFPTPGNHFIAFSFADSEEALLFKSLVEKYSPKNINESKYDDKAKRFIVPAEEVVQKKQGLFQKLFKKPQKKETNETDLLSNLKISRPENPSHENHIGWDAKNQNFDFSQLSKELKRVFKKAGIRKKDLKDTNTALLIADAILNQPLPDAKKKNKKASDKNAKNLEDIVEIGTPGMGGTRRSSTMSSQIKPLQIPSQINSADPLKKSTFQANMAMDKKHNLSKQDEISLTSKLASAIAQRRKQLTKHDVESEEDDWSEDDN